MKTRHLLTLGLASIAVLASCNNNKAVFTREKEFEKECVQKTDSDGENPYYSTSVSVTNKGSKDIKINYASFYAKKDGEKNIDCKGFLIGPSTSYEYSEFTTEAREFGGGGTMYLAFNDDITGYTLCYGLNKTLPFDVKVTVDILA